MRDTRKAFAFSKYPQRQNAWFPTRIGGTSKFIWKLFLRLMVQALPALVSHSRSDAPTSRIPLQVPSPQLNQQAIVTMYDGEEVILLRNLTTKGSHTFLRIRYKSDFAQSDSNRKTKFIEMKQGAAAQVQRGTINEAECNGAKSTEKSAAVPRAAGQCTGQSAEDK
ncbi:unnamed protein product, partial [Darwinula stevensoni]